MLLIGVDQLLQNHELIIAKQSYAKFLLVNLCW